MQMKILFLCKVFPKSTVIGGPILIYHRIKNLSQMGHRVFVIGPCADEDDIKDKSLEPYCEEVIKTEPVPERSEGEIIELKKRLNRPRYFIMGYSEGMQKAFDSEVRKGYDVIIAEYSMVGQYLYKNPNIPSSTKTIISCHECYTRAALMRAEKAEGAQKEREIADAEELRGFEFEMYLSVDKVLTLTEEEKRGLIKYEPRLSERIDVVPHGVDTEFFCPKEMHNDNIILFLGNFEHSPNIDAVWNFVDNCWQRIKREVPDTKFWAIGKNPPDELLKLNSKDGIRVQTGGKDVRPFYWKASVFVAPIELGSGFRGKNLEALACGLPIVSTSLGVEGIDPKDDEILVADDYKQFSEYVIRLLKDPEYRRKIREKGILLAKRFDHRNAAERLNGVICRLMEGG